MYRFFMWYTSSFYCCAYSIADLGDIVYFQTMQNLRLLLCKVTAKKRSGKTGAPFDANIYFA